MLTEKLDVSFLKEDFCFLCGIMNALIPCLGNKAMLGLLSFRLNHNYECCFFRCKGRANYVGRENNSDKNIAK